MRFTYHIGLHCTDSDRALKCLLQNEAALAARGTAIAAPERFRPALREAMLALKGTPAPGEMQERLMDAVTDLDAPDHVMFSSDSFLCVPARAVSGGTLYPLVSERAPWIRNLFPDNPAHFCLALRNPATLLPALHSRFAEKESFDDILARTDPEALSWSDMVARLRAAVPDAVITVWCNEDAPLLWPEILALLAGAPDDPDLPDTLDGAGDFLAELMRPEGTIRLGSYLEQNAPRSASHRRRIIAAFLARFARPSAVSATYDLPGWTEERLARLTETYEADVARIGQMAGVRLMRP